MDNLSKIGLDFRVRKYILKMLDATIYEKGGKEARDYMVEKASEVLAEILKASDEHYKNN